MALADSDRVRRTDDPRSGQGELALHTSLTLPPQLALAWAQRHHPPPLASPPLSSHNGRQGDVWDT